MFKTVFGVISLSIVASILVACGTDDEAKKVEMNKTVVTEKTVDNTSTRTVGKKVDGRWYTPAQLIRGKKVFASNCASCHGDKGQGLTVDWKKPDAKGVFPPPPLNGSAHAWHHSKDLLMRTVNEGGVALGGAMPSFKDKLSEKEKEAVLAHVMSLWPDKIYNTWSKRNPQ
ncbi:MAG: cytochrome c [Cocleimonas sp.]|nr:cytochrome c [Cocleimonas sp.]